MFKKMGFKNLISKKGIIFFVQYVLIFIIYSLLFFLPTSFDFAVFSFWICGIINILYLLIIVRKINIKKVLFFIFLIYLLIVFPYFKVSINDVMMIEKFNEGLQYEKQSDYRKAIKYYNKSIKLFSLNNLVILCHDFIARDYFLLEDYEKALETHNTKTEKLEKFYQNYNFAKLSFEIMGLQKKSKYEESLKYCDEMIKLVKILWNERISNIGEKNYYEGSSEGYIRKYYSLKKLHKEKEAKELLELYKEKYKIDVLSKSKH